MSDYEIQVTVKQVIRAKAMILSAMRRHVKAHKDIPKILFTSPAGMVALSNGALGDDLADMRVMLVAHWDENTNMTVA